MKQCRTYAPCTGRVLLGLLFLFTGIGKAMSFGMMVGYADAYGVPAPAVAVAIAMVLEIGGGLALMWKKTACAAAWTLAALLILISLIFHTGWSGEAGQMEMLNFFKNMAVVGGLLVVAGTCGCDNCKKMDMGMKKEMPSGESMS